MLVKITGWTQAEIDATPADTLDWILAIYREEVAEQNRRDEARQNR